MEIALAVVCSVLVAGFGGFCAGVRVTARNADRLLAVMDESELRQLARRTRARRQLLSAHLEPPAGNPAPRQPPPDTPASEGFDTAAERAAS